MLARLYCFAVVEHATRRVLWVPKILSLLCDLGELSDGSDERINAESHEARPRLPL